MERKLEDRFDELETRMASIKNLIEDGRGNELKFYIFDYAPEDELRIRKETKKIINNNPSIVEFDLYDLMLKLINEEGFYENIIEMEKDYEPEVLLTQVFQQIIPVESDNNKYLDFFKNEVEDDGKHIVLITGVGKAFPIIRSHTILNNLHTIFHNNPVVMFYPGRYDNKKAMCLRLFDKLDDDNYYRAFQLVGRSE